MSATTVRKAPCHSCPYRLDVPSGLWHASEYDKLTKFDGDITEQASRGAFGVFLCHQRTDEMCAGWVACHGPHELLALRVNEVDPSVFDYTTDVPLHASGEAARVHGQRDIEDPGDDAVGRITKLMRLQAARDSS